jgi:hypothetical protein
VRPAQQGLETDDFAAGDILLRLVDEPQLAARDRIAQVVFQKAAVSDRGAHRRFEESIGSSPFILGAIERGIGVGEHGMPISGVIGTYGDADARRDRRIGFRVLTHACQGFQDGLGDAAGHGRIGKPRENNGELVPAEPGKHLAVVKHAGNSLRHRLQHPVARCMPEQVVDLLEPVEVKTQDGESPPRCQGHLDLLVQLLVECAAIGNPRKRIMMRKKSDVLFRLLARLEVANRDGAVGFPGKIERTQDELHRRRRAVGAVQFTLDRLVRPLDQPQAGGFLGKELFERLTDHAVRGRADETRKTVVDGNDGFAVADQKAFDGRIGKASHAVGFEFAAPAIAHLDGNASQGEEDDGKTRNGHRHRQPARVNCGGREFNSRVREDRDCAHGGEMEATDRDGQEQRAENLPLQPIGMQPDRQRDGADQPTEHDRRCHQNRIPNDPSLNLERSHAGVMHGCDTAPHHGAADPSSRRPIRRHGDGQARAGQHDRGNQGENRQRDVVGARKSRCERQHGNEVGCPDSKPRRCRRDDEPSETHAPARYAHVVEQANRGE